MEAPFTDDIRISLFGKLHIRYANKHTVEIEQRRAQELLSYLLLHADRLHDREKLATLMWADKPPSRSKQYLRQTLWQVQSSLSSVTQEHQLLVAEHERIGIDRRTAYWLDVQIFDRAFAYVEQIPGTALSTQHVHVFRECVSLYQGDLLEGCYTDWCIYERERRQSMYLVLLDKLLTYSETHQEYEAGLAYGQQILQYDRARERTHRQLMRLHYLGGNRTLALQQYAACVAALADELDVGPARSTVALYEQICSDQVDTAVNTGSTPQARSAHAGSALSSAQQLEEIQATLAQLQNQVAQLALTFGRGPTAQS